LSEEATHAATFKVMLNNIRAEGQPKLNHNDKGVTGVCARWHMFEEKHRAMNDRGRSICVT
jgi:hypothetical protein